MSCQIRPQSAKLYTGVSLAGRGFTLVCHSVAGTESLASHSSSSATDITLHPINSQRETASACIHSFRLPKSILVNVIPCQIPSQYLLVKNSAASERSLTFFWPGSSSSSPPRDLFSCELCPKTFLHVEALRSHAKNHLLACLDCNKSFADQSGLTKHQEEVSRGLF